MSRVGDSIAMYVLTPRAKGGRYITFMLHFRIFSLLDRRTGCTDSPKVGQRGVDGKEVWRTTPNNGESKDK